MPIEDYLAQGGQLTSPANVPARYRGELLRLMATFVDSELAASAGFADTINDAPGITARIAACRITLEKADHAERVLDAHGRLRRRRGPLRHPPPLGRPPAARRRRSARPAHGGDMRLAVFHYPIEGWTDAVVLNVLQGLAAAVTLEEMAPRLLRPARRRRSAPSPRARSATPTSASPASPTSPPPRTAAPRRRPPSPTGSPRSPTASAPQLRPVRDAAALRPPPPPERGAARRLDRLGPRDAGAPRPRLRRPP